MSSSRSGKARKSSGSARVQAASSPPGHRARGSLGEIADPRARLGLLIVILILAAVVVIGADYVFGMIAGGGGSDSTSSPTAVSTQTATH